MNFYKIINMTLQLEPDFELTNIQTEALKKLLRVKDITILHDRNIGASTLAFLYGLYKTSDYNTNVLYITLHFDHHILTSYSNICCKYTNFSNFFYAPQHVIYNSFKGTSVDVVILDNCKLTKMDIQKFITILYPCLRSNYEIKEFIGI